MILAESTFRILALAEKLGGAFRFILKSLAFPQTKS